MGFLSQHRVNQKRGKSISLKTSGLQKGMIVEAKYSPMTNEGKKGKQKLYMFLILNRSYKTPGTNFPKVHALSMDNFSPAVLNFLAEDIGLRYIPKYGTIGFDIPKLLMEQSTSRFYSTKIRKDITRRYNDSYRTLLLKNFSQIKLIDYKFSNKVMLKSFGVDWKKDKKG